MNLFNTVTILCCSFVICVVRLLCVLFVCYLCCSFVICVVRLLFVLFSCYLCCSMYFLCVNMYCHRVKTQLQLMNIYQYTHNTFLSICTYFLY
jgi:hypothetical protein